MSARTSAGRLTPQVSPPDGVPTQAASVRPPCAGAVSLSLRLRRLATPSHAGDPAESQSAAKGPSDVGGLIPSCRLGHLRLFLDWACRQLQYRSPLPGSEIGD